MRAPISILYEDERLLVASKPPGLFSVLTPGAGGRTLPDALAAQGLAVMPVHRLDRDVSGAVLFARDEETRARLEDLFRAHGLRKTYWALAQGPVKPQQGTWKYPILEHGGFARVSAQGMESITRFRTLRSFASTTELEIELVTGRYNQIRLHAAHAGFPLVGERKYARGKDSPVRFRSRRVALHAWKLDFAHPYSGNQVALECPLPLDLADLLREVEGSRSRPGERGRP